MPQRFAVLSSSVYDWHWRCCAFGVTRCAFIDFTFALLLNFAFLERCFCAFVACPGSKTVDQQDQVRNLPDCKTKQEWRQFSLSVVTQDSNKLYETINLFLTNH